MLYFGLSRHQLKSFTKGLNLPQTEREMLNAELGINEPEDEVKDSKNRGRKKKKKKRKRFSFFRHFLLAHLKCFFLDGS